jgi:CheY-like chemotaxis protein
LLYDTLMDLFGEVSADDTGSREARVEHQAHDAAGARVLLVEDNEMNQQVATELLQSAGAAVTIANDGGEAVKLLKEGPQPPPFDVVLMDLQMPVMDGYTATRLLRADTRFKDLPIIAMTAHALVEERQRCLEAGMNDHVTKPIEPEALFAVLKRWTKTQEKAATQPVRDEAEVPEIDGIDVQGGLRRVAGNKRLLRSLLEQFAAKQADAAAQIAAALQSGDRTLAGRISHTVKGVAGNLGITAVQQAAEKLERALRDGDASEPALRDELELTLGHTVQAIRSALGGTAHVAAGVTPTGPFDATAALAAATRLRMLLEANDGDALDALPALEHALAGVVDKRRLETLRDEVGDFNFEGALTELAEITNLCGVGGK